jgi:hypothetical protein
VSSLKRSSATLIVAIFAVALVMPVGVGAQVAGSQADFQAYATGTAVHLDALQSGATRVEDTELAFSGSSVHGVAGLGTVITNEMQRIVQPSLPNFKSYARGAGIEVGLGIAPNAEDQIILAGKVEVSAPPNVSLQTKEVGPVSGDPLAYASVARGQALANFGSDPCSTLGSDLSRGVGYIADAQLVDTGAGIQTPQLDAPVVAADSANPDRTVSQTTSHDLLIPQVAKDGTVVGQNFGLMSEVRETIAPITLFKGTANAITIELLGEWVLQAVATGIPGQAYIQYGPGAVSPSTPIIRTLNAAGVATNVLTSQQVFGNAGIDIPIPGVADIRIGEAPRAIGGIYASKPTDGGDGTKASAAVNVVSISILEQKDLTGNVTTRAASLLVGHMEVSAQVPAGGIQCPLPVSKVAIPPSLTTGQSFVTNITIQNPFQCPVENVHLTDVITTEKGARFKIEATDPKADTMPLGENLDKATVVFNNLGTIAPGASKTVSVTLRSQGKDGLILDTALASGTLKCPPSSALGQASVSGISLSQSAVRGAAVLREPVGLRALPRTGPSAVHTAIAGAVLLALAGAGFAILRRRSLG